MNGSELGRQLAALRPTTKATCVMCGVTFNSRAKRREAGKQLEPLAKTCSPSCRAKLARHTKPEAYRRYQREYRRQPRAAPDVEVNGDG